MPVSPASSPNLWLIGVGVAMGAIIVALALVLVIVLNKNNTAVAVTTATVTPIAAPNGAPTTSTPVPPTHTAPPVGLNVGNTAPDFTLRDFNGRIVSLSSLRGKPVIINFWASWCGFCRQEMPDLDTLYKESQTQNLVVLGIDTDDQDRSAAEKMVRDDALNFPILWDETNQVGNQYQLRALPTSFFIDESGVIRALKYGSMSRDEMDAKAKLIF